jgi:uncharacterized protein YjbJ (UPF0337 family)
MGKLKNKVDEYTGRAKEAFGDATDNESLQMKGVAQKTGAQARQAGEHAKDAAEDLGRTVTD